MMRFVPVALALSLFPVLALAQDAGLSDPFPFLKLLFEAVVVGDWFAVASALVVMTVITIRIYGPKFRAMLPDENPLDKSLWFLLETKFGGWVLNWFVAFTGGIGHAWLAGQVPSWELVKPALKVAATAAVVWHGVTLAWEFIQERRAAAKVAASLKAG